MSTPDIVAASAVEALDPRAVSPPPAQRLTTLPNGLEVACQSAKETEHIYDDVFAHRVYLSHGVTLWDGATVFDVGGNIGLFSVFVQQNYRDVATYTFEPAPPLFEILHHNVARYARGTAKLFPCGISDAAKTARLTFYPYSSGMSSFYGDVEEEKEVLRIILENQRRAGDAEVEAVTGTSAAASEEFLDARFTEVSFDCPLLPLSTILRQEGVEAVDLLKIDVQKSELDVLRGLEPEDWPKVRQIAMEVHDLDGQLEETKELLEGHDFNLVVEQDPLYESSVMYNLFAVQKDLYRRLSGPAAPSLTGGRRKQSFARFRRPRRAK